ncbi:AraC family transcriptional regulator [Burkholderia lata]|uniref:AraC family transcriptional regulator n=1 Tax=Burkholderia lata (strain ATCC 17760 / DSM 23089 / LMG 22485 / NCIMB 9086 / R18194 / 383) TaxID=482957 RepID=UPI001452B4FB|nr:helix-turn-helix domain-containing protein [Burkholderia lata]VWD64748.1 AraC family transcriptional regulator [Burkholderia lata]
MSYLYIILVPQQGQVQFARHIHPVDSPCLMMAVDSRPVGLPLGSSDFRFSPEQLQSAYRELRHLTVRISHDARLDGPLTVPAGADVLHAVGRLAGVDVEAMLRFVLTYCLAWESRRCTALLRHLVVADRELFDFVYCHRLEPWPVSHYADRLGLPQRKFNELFKDKYGVSAKRWLLARRLEHAKLLLEISRKKVIDIALESGFVNAAHFSDCFRRHFCVSPSEIRQTARFEIPLDR